MSKTSSFTIIYVDDVAHANVRALKSAVPFGMYNVGRGIKTSIKELTELILAITGSTLPIHYEPAGQTFVTNRVGDPEAAAKDLGFTWSVELEDRLKRLIAWRTSHLEQVEQQRKRVS